MPTFLLYDSERERRWTVEAQGDRIFIGRSRQAEVPVPHASVSKQHVLVERKGGRYVFRDLGSKNGTYLNDFRHDHGPLEDGDELRVGAIRIRFYRQKPSAVAALSPDAAVAAAPAEKERTAAVEGEKARAARNASEGESLDLGQTALFPQVKTRSSRRPPLQEVPAAPSTPPASDSIPALPAPVPSFRHSGRAGRHPSAGASGRGVPAAPRRWRLDILLGASAICLGLGLLLGFLGTSLDEPPEGSPPAPPEGRTAGAGSASSPATATGAPGGAPGQGGPESQSGEGIAGGTRDSPFGVLVSLKDTEASTRAAVRLCLDLLNRPPTRSELKELLALPHEERWLKLQGWSRQSGLRLEGDLVAHSKRFLGRAAKPEEEETLLSLSKGDPDHYAFLLASSSFYAGETHRRKRTSEQLARSLITDLLNRAPKESEVREHLKDPNLEKYDVASVAKKLVSSSESRAGPEPGEEPEAWIREAYLRLLLRPPSPEETQSALAAFKTAKEEAWRAILVLLATSNDYLTY